MKKLGQKIILWTLWVIGTLITFGLPLYLLINNLIIGQETKAVYSMITAIILFILFIIISRWLIKIYDRKLQAIAVAEEIGVNPSTPFIISRILKQLEIILPIGIIGLVLYGVSLIQVPAYIIMRDIILWVVVGTIIYLIHDGLKVYFTNINMVDVAIKLDRDKEKRIYRTEMRRGRRHRNHEED